MAESADYTPGDMDVAQQVSMYQRFNSLVHWGSLMIATVLIFFVTWLCAHLGFVPALILAVVVFAAGCFWLTRPKTH